MSFPAPEKRKKSETFCKGGLFASYGAKGRKGRTAAEIPLDGKGEGGLPPLIGGGKKNRR